MSVSALETLLESTIKNALSAIEQSTELEQIEQIKNQYLSKKGFFASQMQTLGKISQEERPRIGKLINDSKNTIANALKEKQQTLEKDRLKAQLAKETIDITLPGRTQAQGGLHPVNLTIKRIEKWFSRFGFSSRLGPEIEDDYHNFTALNIPEHHPARAMQDTFYFDPKTVLRTQTSNVQIHTLENEPLPLRIIAPGRVYRSDSDMTHTPMFHQCEGLVVDQSANFADLKGLLVHFLRDFFARDDLQVRFRPSFFPFTEPSAEVDIAFGEKPLKWLEVLGCGMVHPQVLENLNIDSETHQGYAFGMGIERLAMLRYGVKDLRMFFENDVRFLKQFRDEF